MKRLYIFLILYVAFLAYALLQRSIPEVLLATLVLVVIMAVGVTTPRLQLFGSFICRGDKSKDRIAITFDDGPDPRSTPQLLELLHHRRIPAAFFCIGRRVTEHPGLAAQIFREGHLVENHSHSHSKSINLFSLARLESDLKMAQSVIQQTTGVAPRFYRPPFGHSNPKTFKAAKSQNLTVVGWTVRAFDTVDSNPERVAKRLLRGVKPGAVILLHDGGIPPDRLVLTVKTLLDKVHLLGYEVVRLDKLLS